MHTRESTLVVCITRARNLLCRSQRSTYMMYELLYIYIYYIYYITTLESLVREEYNIYYA